MAITKEKKKEILAELKSVIKNSKSVVFLNFKGLKVEEANALRRELKQSKVNYLVTKKTLLEKTLEGSSFGGEKPALVGELSLAYGEDPIEPARKIFSFKKKLEDKLSILGGIMEGNFIDKEAMTNIAQIPSRETLYGQFVNLINSPIQGLVFTLSAIAKPNK
jgi:large subunit ribosomal protein L10